MRSVGEGHTARSVLDTPPPDVNDTARARYLRAKRVFDMIAAALALVTTAPVSATVAVAIKADSPGPVLFRQRRVGRGGKPFEIYKFRTMTTAAPGERRVAVSATGDARVTSVGAWLRRVKLDELPQLVNVLRGEMSLVGPRPEVPEYVARWDAVHREVILSVRPGITDPTSIEFRHESDLLAAAADPESYYVTELLPRKTAGYVAYVRGASFVGDLRVLAGTVRAVLGRPVRSEVGF